MMWTSNLEVVQRLNSNRKALESSNRYCFSNNVKDIVYRIIITYRKGQINLRKVVQNKIYIFKSRIEIG